MKKPFLFFILFVLLSFNLKDTPSFAEKIISYFTVATQRLPQEKIYLHIDKDAYTIGENIWFRGYLLNAATHRQNVLSNFIYVDLIDRQDSLVSRIKSIRIDSCFFGQLTIPTHVQQGEYSLTAYTYRMQNDDDDFFFRKKIRIANPKDSRMKTEISYRQEDGKHLLATLRLTDIQGDPIPKTFFRYSVNKRAVGAIKREMVTRTDDNGTFQIKLDTAADYLQLYQYDNRPFPFKRNIAIPKLLNDFDVQFFPEGGALLAGTRQKVAFKAIGNNGMSIDVSCDVYMDTLFVAHARSEHDGMGIFYMPVSPDLPHYVVVKTNGGQEKRFELPRPDRGGFGFSVRQNDTVISYNILLADQQKVSKVMYLFTHCRGNLTSIAPLTSLKGEFDLDLFPEGINHIVLADEEGKIYSQRLFFRQRKAVPVVTVSPDKKTYKSRELVNLTIQLNGTGQDSLTGSCSLSVTDDSKVETGKEENNIISSLLLTSDLKGHIENPEYYFQDDTPEVVKHLDLLMMTHGWTRFNVSDIIQGNFPQQNFAYEVGQVISGNLKGHLSRKINGASVLLLSNTGIFKYTGTDEKGNFIIDDILFSDSTQFMINALKAEGSKVRKNVTLTIDPDRFPPAKYLFPYRESEEKEEKAFFDKFKQEYYYEDGVRIHVLKEAVVTAAKKRGTTVGDHTFADYSLDSMQIAQIGGHTIEDLIAHSFPSISVGINSSGEPALEYHGKPPMLIMWNGFPEKFSKIRHLRLAEFKNVALFTPDRASFFYGRQGANGVLVVKTDFSALLGKMPDTHKLSFSPLGFQKPDEFYVPKYNIDSVKFDNKYDERTTIFWKPVIHLEENKSAHVLFYTADIPGNYSVTLEGITTSGLPYRKKITLKVK